MVPPLVNDLKNASPLLAAACTPQTGPPNVDGACVQSRLYAINDVPYRNGRVAGPSYSQLMALRK